MHHERAADPYHPAGSATGQGWRAPHHDPGRRSDPGGHRLSDPAFRRPVGPAEPQTKRAPERAPFSFGHWPRSASAADLAAVIVDIATIVARARIRADRRAG